MYFTPVVKACLDIPPVTKIFIGCTLILSFLIYIELMNQNTIALSLPHIFPYFYKISGHRPQIWRLFFSSFYFSFTSIDTILSIMFLYRYSSMLETQSGFSRSTWSHVILLGSVHFIVVILSLLFRVPFTSSSFSCAITYIWTRFNPTMTVAILGFITFPAFYLPFLVPFITYILEDKVPYEDIIGMIAGHIYYFIIIILPRCRGALSRFKEILYTKVKEKTD